jgi:hypothetical protein
VEVHSSNLNSKPKIRGLIVFVAAFALAAATVAVIFSGNQDASTNPTTGTDTSLAWRDTSLTAPDTSLAAMAVTTELRGCGVGWWDNGHGACFQTCVSDKQQRNSGGYCKCTSNQECIQGTHCEKGKCTNLAPGQITTCASQDEMCNCHGTVYYGKKFANGNSGPLSTFAQLKDAAHTQQVVMGDVKCSVAVMADGKDPMEGVQKKCMCLTTGGDYALRCAQSEHDTCDCDGTVFYGRKYASDKPVNGGEQATFSQMKTTNYNTRTVSGSVTCSNEELGDPMPGHYGACWCQVAVTTSPATYGPSYECPAGSNIITKWPLCQQAAKALHLNLHSGGTRNDSQFAYGCNNINDKLLFEENPKSTNVMGKLFAKRGNPAYSRAICMKGAWTSPILQPPATYNVAHLVGDCNTCGVDNWCDMNTWYKSGSNALQGYTIGVPIDAPWKITTCASQDETCACHGTVYYGRKYANGAGNSGPLATFAQLVDDPLHTKQAVMGEVKCSVAAMAGGKDPMYGVQKKCMCVTTGCPSVNTDPTKTPRVVDPLGNIYVLGPPLQKVAPKPTTPFGQSNCAMKAHKNMRGPGGNENLAQTTATSAADCSYKCTGNKECTYFVYETNGDCWLKKGAVLREETCADCTSGLRCTHKTVVTCGPGWQHDNGGCLQTCPRKKQSRSSGGYCKCEHNDDCIAGTYCENDQCTNLAPADKPECKIGGAEGQCYSIDRAIDATKVKLAGSKSNLELVNNIVSPILDKVLEKAADANKDFGEAMKFGMCGGKFTGKQITTYKIDGETADLSKAGCYHMPLKSLDNYQVFSMTISTALLASFGICEEGGEDSVAAMCVAFTGCDGGWPTVAFQISGPAIGCIGGSPEVEVSSLGVGALFAEGATIGIGSVGLGLSMTGAFTDKRTVYAGVTSVDLFQTTSVSVNGNMYANIASDLSKLVPQKVRDYFSISGTALIIAQIGKNGKIKDEVKNLFSGNPMTTLTAMEAVTTVASVTITCQLKLKDLSSGILANMDLGAKLELNAVITGQQHQGLRPGFYLYAENKVDIMGAIATWMMTNFGGIIDKIAGSGASKKAAKAINSLGLSEKTQFGFYINDQEFGFILNLPGSMAAEIINPAMGFLGDALGDLKIQCTFHAFASPYKAHCGVHFGAPKWAAAAWKETKKIAGDIVKGTEMVIGAVHENFDKAMNNLKDELKNLGGDFKAVGEDTKHAAQEMYGGIKDAAAWMSHGGAENLAKKGLAFGKEVGHDIEHVGKEIGHWIIKEL